MSTIEQTHLETVKAVKRGFLPTYLADGVRWEGGVVVIQTNHSTIKKLKGPAIRIPAPTRYTLNEVNDTLSEGTWYSGAAQWDAAQANSGLHVWSHQKDSHQAVSFLEDGSFQIEDIKQFTGHQNLVFIQIYSKHLDR